MDRRSPVLPHTGGLLLAGGRSSRFSAEKAVAPFAGRLMMDAVLNRFALLGHCAVSARAGCAAEAHAHASGLPVLHDAPNTPAGPLAGVAAGLAWANTLRLTAIATAPCDTPLLPQNVFPTLLASLGDAPAVYAVTENAEHPLCAVWRVELGDRVAAALSGGQHPPVRRLLADLDARRVHFGDARAFANANTPDALAALEHAA